MIQQFSPNMLKTFKLCPKKFEFKYIKKISMPVNDEIFETGKNIHALASYYLRKENVDKLELALNPAEQELWKYLKSLNYLNYECIKTEYNLAIKNGNYFFGGRLDALVKNNEYYYILDYKTGAAPKSPDYDFQTMIYLLCVRAFYKTDKVKFVYLDLKNKSEVVIELTDNLAKEYEEILNKIAEMITQGDFVCSAACIKSKQESSCEKKAGHTCEYELICYH